MKLTKCFSVTLLSIFLMVQMVQLSPGDGFKNVASLFPLYFDEETAVTDVTQYGIYNKLKQTVANSQGTYPLYSEAEYSGTGTSLATYAARLQAYHSGTGVASYLVGALGRTYSTSSGNTGIASGFFGGVYNPGTGTISTAYGTGGYVENTSTGQIDEAFCIDLTVKNTNAGGTIDKAYGVALTPDWTNSGTINTSRGIWISTGVDVGTTRHAIYSDSTSDSCFAGSMGFGTFGPDRQVDILDASAPQLRLTYADGTVYVDFQADANGDLTITPSGGDVTVMGTLTPGIVTFHSVLTTLTAAQVNACRATPVAVVAAGGANTWIEIVSATVTYDYDTTAFTVGGDEDLVIEYADGTDATAGIETTGFLDQADDEIRFYPNVVAAGADIEAAINQGLRIFNTGTGETADGGSSEVDVRVVYRVYQTGF